MLENRKRAIKIFPKSSLRKRGIIRNTKEGESIKGVRGILKGDIKVFETIEK